MSDTKEMKLSMEDLFHMASLGYASIFEKQGKELNQKNTISYAASCMAALLSSLAGHECENCSDHQTKH